jgi:hypothetical protein
MDRSGTQINQNRRKSHKLHKTAQQVVKVAETGARIIHKPNRMLKMPTDRVKVEEKLIKRDLPYNV